MKVQVIKFIGEPPKPSRELTKAEKDEIDSILMNFENFRKELESRMMLEIIKDIEKIDA